MACQEAPALVLEKNRLSAIGGRFLGIIGDANHSFGYHLCSPPGGDYSLEGAANNPVDPYSCAIDCGMDWSASRQWLAWLITEIREDRIQGIAEVIGSLDGEGARYWSDGSGWHQNGVEYGGDGHVTWTHVAIYRSTALVDHKILAGWTASGYHGSGGGGVTAFDETHPAYGSGMENGYATHRGILHILDGRDPVTNMVWKGQAPPPFANKLHQKLDAILTKPAVDLTDAQLEALAERLIASGLGDAIAETVVDLLASRLTE